MDKYNQKWTLWFAQEYSATNAVTLGQTTYYSESQVYVRKHPEWQAHEDKHKEQWAREGRIKFALKYLWYHVRYGYRKNPYEVESRASEAQWICNRAV